MADTFAKKERQKKKAKRKLDKAEKREERKTNNNKGKSLEEMTVYLDENGNFTDVPPEKQIKKKINAKDIQLGAANIVDTHLEYTGTVALLFTDKGYGFITDDETRANIFVHNNNFLEIIQEKDRVVYKKEKTPKGYAAVSVKKIK
ncbi:MAG TPA: cold shock domain-containing protein [Chitinophagales bacterium]|nr:cold shock domain-containing protein [Chitinophagales bacterium]